ncbi:MAG: NAD-binding protein [Nanoarchaeota archaeon]|nr:NAD-binding protein [Nanoarchaeota archaeon]
MDKKEEHDVLIKVIVSSIVLIFFIYIGSELMYDQTNNWPESIFKATTIITHTYAEPGPNAPLFFVLSIAGSIIYIYLIYVIILIFFRGRFSAAVQEVYNMRRIQKMENHTIICGGGRVGSSIADELKKMGKKYVIVESNAEVGATLKKKGHPVLAENSIKKESLITANIGKADAVVSCLGNDPDNVVQVLLARDLNKSVTIIARANYPDIEEKLRIVGANKIIMPEKIGGERIAELISGG